MKYFFYIAAILILLFSCKKEAFHHPIAETVVCEVAKKKPKQTENCWLVTEYNPGKLMGNFNNVEYGIFFDSTNSICCTCFQNDSSIIAQTLGAGGVFYLNYDLSGLDESQQADVTNRIRYYYRNFNASFTTDGSSSFNQEVIFTAGTGTSGGQAVVYSFNNNYPCWIYPNLYSNNTVRVGSAAAHEIGHTLGLRHQSQWK